MEKNEDLQETVNSVIDVAMDRLKQVIDVNTIVGKAIKFDNTTIIPVSKVSVGFVAGGGELSIKKQIKNEPFAGGSGSGFVVTPIGFVVIENNNTKYIPCEENKALNEIVKLSTTIINKLSGENDVDKE